MPTINQLIRTKRGKKVRNSKSPVLGIGFNSKDKVRTIIDHHKCVEYVLVFLLKHQRSQTQL